MTTSSKLRRVAVAILATATAMAGLIPLTAGSASAVSGFTFTRLSGTDRFDTARRIAVATFGTADTVLLARADLFPDALSGSYLAGSTDGGSPMLLTEVSRIPAATNEALATLGTKRVILLGGPAAISPAVEAELRSRNLQVERIGGRDRFETSQQIAERLGATNVGLVDGERTAVVASGRNFPDALAGGPVSFARRLPSILTDTNTLPTPARNALSNLGIRKVFLLGGPAAVSGNVQSQIEGLGITVERLGGANRQATAALVATTAVDRLGFDDTHINLARGDFFTDALTGGAHAGDEGDGGASPGSQPAPIVLTVSPTILGADTTEFLRANSATLRDGHIFGGPAAISTAVEGEAARAAGSGRATITIDQTSVAPGGTITGGVTGESISRIVVSGCGLSEREVIRTGDGDFSLTIPTSQPPGECSLTFRVTFTDGAVETDTFGLTITSAARAATAAPELLSVTFVRRFTQPNPGGISFTQTVMRYTFDEAVTGQALLPADSASPCVRTAAGCSLKFKLYSFDQNPTVSQNPNRIYEGRNAQVDPGDTSSVLVTFGQSGMSLTETLLRDVTVGAVDKEAVADSSNVANPYGDAGLNSVTFGAGTTIAPDLIGVDNFRPNFDTTRTLVDFTFDEPAVASSNAQNVAIGGGYNLVLNDADATERICNYVSGDGATKHTVSCATLSLTQIASSSVARAIIAAGTVASPQAGTTTTFDANQKNPMQAFAVTNSGATTRPDLVSAQFFNGRVDGTAADFDQVLYTFDESVILPTSTPQCGATCFAVYTADGNEVLGRTSSPDGISPGPPVRPTDNDRQIVVTFGDGTIEEATGASVGEGAVLEAVGTGGVNRTNRRDEVAVQGITFATGSTTGPDFVRCETEVTARNPITGAPTGYQLVFSFDEDVRSGSGTIANDTPGPVASSFVLYNSTGTKIDPTTASATRRDSPNDNQVLVGGFTQENLAAAASCGVAEGAVTEQDTTKALNPIGYEPITR